MKVADPRGAVGGVPLGRAPRGSAGFHWV